MNQQPKLVINTADDIEPRMEWCAHLIRKGLAAGPVVVTLGRDDQKRSNDQNRLLWKLLTDISQQVVYMERKHSPEVWKDLISALWKGQKMLPGLDGGIVVLGVRTSRLTKKQFSELIEVIYATGSERGVQWSTDTATEYENFKEAGQ